MQPQFVVAPPCRTNEAQFQQFTRGLAAVLNQWTALHLVAQHCDSQAFPNLFQDLVDWHVRDGEVYSDEMELFFEEFFNSARSVIIEDDSMKEVGDVLHDMYCRCSRDDYSTVEHFVQTEVVYRQTNPLAMCVNGGTGSGGDNEDDFALGNGRYASLEEAQAASEGVEIVDDDLSDANGNEEEEASVVVSVKKPLKKKKNAFKKGADGWNVVQ